MSNIRCRIFNCGKRIQHTILFAGLLAAVLLTVSLSPGEASPEPKQDVLSKVFFLVADKHITGSIFANSVVFLISYDQSGALGVIINKPSDVKLSSVFPDIKGLANRKDTAFIGGPVSVNLLMILIRSRNLYGDSLPLFDDVYLSSDTAALKEIVDGKGGNGKFRVYAGYAGWDPGQLENEISRGDWRLVQADPKYIFDKPASSIWPELYGKAAGLQI